VGLGMFGSDGFCEVALLRMVDGGVSESESESSESESEELEEVLELESEELLEDEDEDQDDGDEDTARFLALCFATVDLSSEISLSEPEISQNIPSSSLHIRHRCNYTRPYLNIRTIAKHYAGALTPKDDSRESRSTNLNPRFRIRLVQPRYSLELGGGGLLVVV
jgi:hypothetical protein